MSQTHHFLLFVILNVASSLTYELHHRPSKIRFPTESSPLTQQIYTVGPQQLYESESQAVPIVYKGVNTVPYTYLQQVPLPNIPQYADLGVKGFNDGMMSFYQPLIKQDNEFHHTVPPPERMPAYSHQKPVTISKPKQQFHQMQSMQHMKPPRHHDRIRVSTLKYASKPLKTRPSVPSTQPSHSHLQYNQDLKANTQSLPLYKYPIMVPNSYPQSAPQIEYSEGDYEEDIHRRPTAYKLRINQDGKQQITQTSEDYSDLEEKIPEWKLKAVSSLRDTSVEGANIHYYSNHQLNHPESNDEDSSKYYDDDNEEAYSYEEQNHEHSPTKFNRYNKHFVPTQSSAEHYKHQKLELKKLREPINENLKQYNYHTKPPGSVEIFSSKDLTDSLPYLSKTEKYKPSQQYNNYQSKKTQIGKPQVISGSDWIPINAPDGALPAKSYEIPAPDLSRGQSQWQSNSESEQASEGISSLKNRRPSNVVYGGRKQGEGVVSASVMVKQ